MKNAILTAETQAILMIQLSTMQFRSRTETGSVSVAKDDFKSFIVSAKSREDIINLNAFETMIRKFYSESETDRNRNGFMPENSNFAIKQIKTCIEARHSTILGVNSNVRNV